MKAILGKNADDITKEEYEALSLVYLNAAVDDLEKFLGYCMDGEDVYVPGSTLPSGPVNGQLRDDYSKWTVNMKKSTEF